MPAMGGPVREGEMDFSFLPGAWEIVDCGLETARGDNEGVLGAIFVLTEDGDVSWKLPERHIEIPMFASETYETVAREPFPSTFIRFGSCNGRVIEFRIEKYFHEEQAMKIHEGLLYMTCKKVTDGVPGVCILELPYTLLPSYEQGYFTDLSIVASNKRQFRVHTCILKILAPDVDWRAQPTPFSALPDNIIDAIIHYLYTYSLPAGLSSEAAEEIIKIASNYPGFEDLISLCQTFIRNVTLAKDMASLISDVKFLLVQATGHFAIRSDMRSIREPEILCDAVMNAIRDVAVAVSKILLFCDVYNKRKDEFSKKGVNEIIRFTRSHIPFFANQMKTFMHVIKAAFGSLSPSERHELAIYLMPDIGLILDAVINVLLRAHGFFGNVLFRLGSGDSETYRLKLYNFNEHMKKMNHIKEASKIRLIVHKIESLMYHLRKKRDRLRSLNSENKVRTLTRSLDHLIDRLPFLLLRVEEITEELERKCGWIESQFCFRMSTAKVGEFLATLLENKEPARALVSALCDVLQQDEFTQSAVALGILDPELDDIENLGAGGSAIARDEDHALNLTQFIRDPPPPRRNALCKNALLRLKDAVETDMVLRVIPSEVPDEDEDDEEEDLGDFTDDDEEGSVDEQSQADVWIKVVAAKVEDASSAPKGAVDASCTDRGTYREATAHTEPKGACASDTEAKGACASDTEAKGACASDTEAKGACASDTEAKGAGPNVKADGAATGDTKIEDAVSTEKRVDGTARGRANSGAEDAVPTAGGDGAARGKNGEEGAASTEKQLGDTARGNSGADDAVETAKGDGAARGIKEVEEGGGVVAVRAHRAIIAARCPLYKRALLSGMIEDINRMIDVRNIRPKLFPIFLEYLYSGVMDYSKLTARQIADMFLIADCYELDSFKQGCERALRICIDDNSVLLFLNMADKYNAPILMEACKKYVRENPTVPLDNLLYDEMPRKLKSEIYDMVVWGKDRVLLAGTPDQSGDGSDAAGARAVAETESDTDSRDVRRFDIDDCVPSTTGARFRLLLEEMSEIVEPGVPRRTLAPFLLAADCDLNRALNYYYSSCSCETGRSGSPQKD